MNLLNKRNDFSVLRNNPELIYFDSAATSLKPDVVIDAMTDYYKKYPFSIHRGSYKMSLVPSNLYDESRSAIANFLNVDFSEVVFTKSTTASINNLSKSLDGIFNKGDEIIVSNMEHHSNFLPWKILANRLELKLVVVEAVDFNISAKSVIDLINDKTKLIAIHHVSNVIGNEVDVKKICTYAKDNGILTMIDGAQAAPHKKVNLKDIGCDFYTISGHKLLGPTGLGILYINKDINDKVLPFEYGGDMVSPSTVDIDDFLVKDAPYKYEAGTPLIAEVIGMGEAIKYINEIGIENIHNHVVGLKKYAISKLNELLDIVEVYNANIENSLITFNIKNVAVHDAVSESFLSDVTFDKNNIALRDGQHCNNLTMKYVIGQKSVLRASFYFYNTYEEVDKFVEVIKEIYKKWN